MFLVTTALEEFWDKTKEIVFLGEWCKLYSRKHIWEGIKHSVLPYHWDNRERLFQDYLYLDRVYEKYLSVLTRKLNEIHKVNHSELYWRIIIGPWLFYFIEILFDRYLSIVYAGDVEYISNTWITDTDQDFFIPRNFKDFFENCIDDKYNHLLYSYLIKKRGNIPYEIVNNTSSNEIFFANRKIGLRRKIALNLINTYNRLIPANLKRYIFVAPYLKRIDLFKLQLSLGQLPTLYSFDIDMDFYPDVDKKIRNNFVLSNGANEYECILDELIPYQMPVLYIEGYEAFYRYIDNIYSERPALIFTANASISIEGFKFWTAREIERGSRLVLSQHGGHHGMGKWSSELKHEITISDLYFTWGWKEKDNLKLCPMPSGKLSRLKKEKIKPKRDGNILWVLMGLPRYSYWMYSIPVGPQMLIYLEEQKRFADGVSEPVRDLLLIRPYMRDFGWNERLRLKDMMPSIKQDDGKKTMLEQLQESRLFIGTYNATTYLEAFAADFPTIIFWNPSYWELCEEAEPYFNILHDAGILHYSPESAAKKVNDIFDDPMSWWMSDNIQRAKNIFCGRFALTADKWINIWEEKLKGIV